MVLVRAFILERTVYFYLILADRPRSDIKQYNYHQYLYRAGMNSAVVYIIGCITL